MTFRGAMLFIPPQPPVQLGPDAHVLLGRSRTCDITLASADASRRHAEIVAVQGGYLIRDLCSTNGTFVNGESVRERQLRPGDRIEIGGGAITFCEVGTSHEAPSADDGEAKTILVERPALSDVFQGELAEIPPFAVLQILEMARNSGVLRLDSDMGPGRLWLEEGIPIHAETKGQTGFDAALAMVNARSGRFTFEPLTTLPEKTIQASVTELLLEASRILDEGG